MSFCERLSLCLLLVCVVWRAELTMGQWVMGQMGRRIWVGHVGHGSVPVTRWPMKFTRSCLSERFRATTALPTDVGWADFACSSTDVDGQSAQTGSKSALIFFKQRVQFREILIF